MKLVEKFSKEDCVAALVPEKDFKKFQETEKLDVKMLSSKIAEFEERRRVKVQILKEQKQHKEIEDCTFAPQMVARTSKAKEQRNLEEFLKDQKEFDDQRR